MARPLKPIDPTASPFGYELRRRRLDRGLKLIDLGRKMGFTHSYISQVEHGRQRPTRQFAELAERALQTGGALLRVYENAVSEAKSRDTDRGFAIVARLAEVTALVDDEVSKITDQGDDVERRSALKLAGAAALGVAAPSDVISGAAKASGGLDPEIVRYYQGVTALYRRLDRHSGSSVVAIPAVQHVERLMMHLRQTPEREPVWPQLTVATADAAHLAGWLSFDRVDWSGADRWYRLAGELALKAGDLDFHANSVVQLARLRIEQGQHAEAIAMLVRVGRLRLSRRSAANVVVHRAHALVAANKEREALTTFDEAHKILAKPGADDRPPSFRFLSYMDAGHIENWKGLDLIRLGRPKSAIPSLEKGLAAMPPAFRRARGEALLNLGHAYLEAGELDEACSMFAQAFPILSATRSRRHLRTFHTLYGRLAPHHKARSVQTLGEVVRAATPGHEA